MKAKLEFNLNKHEERKAFLRCSRADDMAVVLHYLFNNFLRNEEVSCIDTETIRNLISDEIINKELLEVIND